MKSNGLIKTMPDCICIIILTAAKTPYLKLNISVHVTLIGDSILTDGSSNVDQVLC